MVSGKGNLCKRWYFVHQEREGVLDREQNTNWYREIWSYQQENSQFQINQSFYRTGIQSWDTGQKRNLKKFIFDLFAILSYSYEENGGSNYKLGQNYLEIWKNASFQTIAWLKLFRNRSYCTVKAISNVLNVSENSRGLQQFDIGFNNKLGPTFGNYKQWKVIGDIWQF